MPLQIALDGVPPRIQAEPLTAAAFAPFGAVIENPQPQLHPSQLRPTASSNPLPFNAVSANQGSAIKYQHVTRPLDLYRDAPSGQPAAPIMSMFVCAARVLSPAPPGAMTGTAAAAAAAAAGVFPVRVLERHPFTTQTFVPLGAARNQRRYLVIVAPSLPPSSADAALPVPSSASSAAAAAGARLPGRGLPDLRGLRAFVASGAQAVTYGAGTWHAPMAALGPEATALDFVVVQFANGVALEDCQEVEFALPSGSSTRNMRVVDVPQPGPQGVDVVVPQLPSQPTRRRRRWKL